MGEWYTPATTPSRMARRDASKGIEVREDEVETMDESSDGEQNGMDESRDPLEDSGCTQSTLSEEEDSDDNEVEDSVKEDIHRLEQSFVGFGRDYKLLNRIGEGTFSTVYKAEDLRYDAWENRWDFEAREAAQTSGTNRRSKRRKPRYVAVKKIYVTSSPQRIMNELELLHALRHCRSVAPLITAFRGQDQVVAILPYFRHLDFRTYFRELNVTDMRIYFRALFAALVDVHSHGIIHRDIKPTNFLYDVGRKRGVLVDFGLAEREGTDWAPCLCQVRPDERKKRIEESYYATHERMHGYPKADQRHSLRANRAGTRGFRAPEVLFKCTAQTCKIDIWSVGVILLTMLAKRFPFFNSADDIDAVVELSTLFGTRRMRKSAMQHGQVLETNLPTLTNDGYSLEKIIIWSENRPSKDKLGNKTQLRPEQKLPVDLLEKCLSLHAETRISAEQALEHPFLAPQDDEDSNDEMDVLALSSPTC